mgnify:CR=1 FL=1
MAKRKKKKDLILRKHIQNAFRNEDSGMSEIKFSFNIEDENKVASSVDNPFLKSAAMAKLTKGRPPIGFLSRSGVTTEISNDNQVEDKEERTEPSSSLVAQLGATKQQPDGNQTALTVTEIESPNNEGKTGVIQGYDEGNSSIEQEYNEGKTGVKQEYDEGTNEGKGKTHTRVKHGYNEGKEPDINSLVGQQRKILEHLFRLCKQIGSRETPKMSRQAIMDLTEIKNENSIKVGIRVLVEKGLLERCGGKGCPGGFSVFRFPENVFLKCNLGYNEGNTGVKQGYNEGTNEGNNGGKSAPSKLVSNIYNTNLLEDELNDIDFHVLERFKINASVTEDIKRNKWAVTRAQIEDHIDRFSKFMSDKSSTSKTVANPRGLFFSHIKKIAETGVDPLNQYETEIDRLTRINFEQAKAKNQRRCEMESSWRDEEFKLWYESNREDVLKIVPEEKHAKYLSSNHKRLARTCWEGQIWPALKNQRLDMCLNATEGRQDDVLDKNENKDMEF